MRSSLYNYNNHNGITLVSVAMIHYLSIISMIDNVEFRIMCSPSGLLLRFGSAGAPAASR